MASAWIAFGLAAWTELVAGLAAGVLLAVELASRRKRPVWCLAGAAVALLWLAPLIPGAWLAAQHQVFPSGPAGPDLRPEHGLGGGQWGLGLLAAASFATTGTVRGVWVALGWLLVGAIFARWAPRSVRWGLAALLVMMVGASVLDSQVAGLRPRHLLFLPMVAALVGAGLIRARVLRWGWAKLGRPCRAIRNLG